MIFARTSEDQLAWELAQPASVTTDVIWKLDVYRASLYLLHCVQHDLCQVNPREHVKDQLIRAAGDLAAAVAEGYSRPTPADRVRFYGYGLGSVRECTVWYLGLRDSISPALLEDRLSSITRCRALLLGLIKSERAKVNPPTSQRDRQRGRFEP